MNQKIFAVCFGVIVVALMVIWGGIFMNMSESSKIPLVIGGFIAGWYLCKFFIRAKGVMRNDA